MNKMAVANNIMAKIREWSVTERSVADMIGVTEKCVNNWVTGRRQPTAYAVLRLSRLFACSMEELMEGVDEQTGAQETAESGRDRATKPAVSGRPGR